MGRTSLIRATILRDDASFKDGFTNDVWRGVRLNAGDDRFLTRWLQTRSWAIHVQNAPEAEVLTTVKQDRTFLSQLARWSQNTLISELRHMTYEPGIIKMWLKYPYTARKSVGMILKPLLSSVQIYTWFSTFRRHPLLM